MSNKISTERKGLYYLGLVLMVAGVMLFLSSFFIANEPGFSMGPPPFFQRALIGMICIIIGSVLMNVGLKGTAGSGLILDPNKARDDLKPFSSAKGKIINDVIENIDVVRNISDIQSEKEVKDIIKVRCSSCRELNDEDAKFCKSCGKQM